MAQAFLGAAAAPSSETFREAVYRKVGWRLLPLLIVSYALAYIDRVNISFAKLQMQGDLGLSEAAYGFGAGIFFLGYVLFEVPSNLLLARIGARATLSRIMLLWGLTSSAMMFVHDEMSFFALRFLLGVFEAGFGPGMLFYLTLWYGRERRGRVMAGVLLAGPVAGIVGGPLATFLMTYFDGAHGLAGWQWLFLLEGLPCIAMAAVLFKRLDDSPEKAAWLTEEERSVIREGVSAGSGQRQHHSMAHAMRDGRIYALAFAYFCMIAGLYAVSFWLPTLLRTSGVKDTMTIGALSALPYLAAILAMLAFGRHSDKTGRRYIYGIVACLISAAGLLATGAMLGNLPVALTSLVIATAATYVAYTVFWTIPAELLAGSAAAGGIALINSIGLIGGFISPTLIGAVQAATGSLQGGLASIAVGLVIGSCVLVVLQWRDKRAALR